MEEKDHGIWTNRPAVQKAFDDDPQHAYNTLVAVLTLEGQERLATLIEAGLVPQPTVDDVKEELEAIKGRLELAGVDTAAIDSKIEELSRQTTGGAKA